MRSGRGGDAPRTRSRSGAPTAARTVAVRAGSRVEPGAAVAACASLVAVAVLVVTVLRRSARRCRRCSTSRSIEVTGRDRRPGRRGRGGVGHRRRRPDPRVPPGSGRRPGGGAPVGRGGDGRPRPARAPCASRSCPGSRWAGRRPGTRVLVVDAEGTGDRAGRRAAARGARADRGGRRRAARRDDRRRGSLARGGRGPSVPSCGRGSRRSTWTTAAITAQVAFGPAGAVRRRPSGWRSRPGSLPPCSRRSAATPVTYVDVSVPAAPVSG